MPSLLKSLRRDFPERVITMGETLFVTRQTRLLQASAALLRAAVACHSVEIRREEEALEYSCACRTFADTLDLCGHLWAALLEANRRIILNE